MVYLHRRETRRKVKCNFTTNGIALAPCPQQPRFNRVHACYNDLALKLQKFSDLSSLTSRRIAWKYSSTGSPAGTEKTEMRKLLSEVVSGRPSFKSPLPRQVVRTNRGRIRQQQPTSEWYRSAIVRGNFREQAIIRRGQVTFKLDGPSLIAEWVTCATRLIQPRLQLIRLFTRVDLCPQSLIN